MEGISATSLAVFAFVDLVAIAGGVFFLWRAMRRTWRFARRARRSSFSAALAKGRHTAHRQAYRCAVDVQYYLSRLALMSCVNLLAVTGVMFASFGLAVRPANGSPMAPESWQLIAICSLLIFVAFMGWSFTRTVRLARRVLRIRRNLRAASARRLRGQ